MSSPEPIEDPYVALGVAKDADTSAIRSAHRKLVLRFHPDRIKDEAERIKGKDVFQKVQQAYELLSDSARRSRYDDRVKLVQLRKEAMAREPTVRMGTYPSRAPPSTPSREFRDGRVYEERVPTGSYFDEGYRYREDEPRTSSRKYDDYDRPRSSSGRAEKEKKSAKWPEKVASEIPYNIAIKLKAKAAKTKEALREKEKSREKESHVSSAKSRDRDQNRDRLDKQSRRAYVEDDSSSDSDTATYVTVNRQPSHSSKVGYDSPPRAKARPEPTKRTTSSRHEEDDDKWQGYHGSARDYIERSQRPGVSRTGSAQSAYWDTTDDRESARKGSSDNDRRSKPSKVRRPSMDDQKTRPPPMPSRNSAPVGLAAMQAQAERQAQVERDSTRKQRSSTGTTSSRSQQMPQMLRSQTMPSKPVRKGDAVPIRSSNLKHAETHDSGYGSSGGQTPDLSGTSPPRHASTKYQIVDDDDEDDVRTILVDPEDNHRRTRSPASPPKDRDSRRRPTVSAGDRSKSSRGASQSTVEMDSSRPIPHRQDSTRPAQPRSGSEREPPSMGRHNSERERERSRKLYAEVDPYTVRYPQVNSSPRINQQDIKFSQHARRPSVEDSDRDFYPHSNHREALRSPQMGIRRESVN